MRFRALLALTLAALFWPVPAGAQTAVSRAAEQLRRDPVYVEPGAERGIAQAAADDLRDRIRRAGSPLFVAILPSSAAAEVGGDPSRLPSALQRAVGLAGTYAVVAGNSFRASSTVLPSAPALATAALQAHRAEGTEAVLVDFVERVRQAAETTGSGREAPGARPPTPAPDRVPAAPGQEPGGLLGGGFLSLLLLLALVAVGVGLYRRSQRQRRAFSGGRDLQADREMLRAELLVLGDDVIALEPEVTLHPEARADYEAATSRYRVAQAALDRADDPADLDRVARVVAEGRYAMSRARARLEGREPPPPPEELRQPGRRDEPALDVDERGEPTYVGYGSPFYGPGWFGVGGGLLGGFLLGQALGGVEHHHHYEESSAGGDDLAGGMGDLGESVGGGDWGGDFGAGDFGGGDVGGGDW